MASTKVEVTYLLNCAADYMAEAVEHLKENNTEEAKTQALKALTLLEVVGALDISAEEAEGCQQATHTLTLISKKILAR